MKQVGFVARLLTVAAVLALAAFVVAGCGDDNGGSAGTDSSGNKTYSADQPLGESKKTAVDSEDKFDAKQQEVIATIAAFGDATASQDYKALCGLLSSEAQKIGGDCEDTFKKTGATIKDFKLTVKSVTVDPDGKTAKAQVSVTSNANPKPQLQDISLVQEKGEWKIQILGQ